jgi:uncharacterized protein (TIGR00251 family)
MFYQWQDENLILNVRVQPRAANDAFAEYNDDYIKIRITAPPVDGKANEHLIAYLAKVFKVAKSGIRLLSGKTGRNKCLLIQQPKMLPDVIGRHMAART